MALDRCIRDTAAELGISERDAREIAEALERHRKKLQAEGRLDRAEADLRKFAADQAGEKRIMAALKRKQAALNVIVRDRLDKHLDEQVAKGVEPDEAIVSFLAGGIADRQSVSALRMALEGDWVKGLEARIQSDVPLVFEMVRRPLPEQRAFFADVVREMHELRPDGSPGRTKNADAAKLAGVFAEYAEAARLEANKAGANIGKLRGWAGPQNWDERTILKAGVDQWAKLVGDELDAERSFGEGATPERADAILREVYYNIVTGRDRVVSGREKGERSGPSSVANSLNAHRVLHFKDADAWLRVQDLFGRGTIVDGMLAHQNAIARKVSLMKMLGPNPEVMLGSVVEERARRERLFAPGREEAAAKRIGRLRLDESSRIGRVYAAVSGHDALPSNVGQARIWANVRATVGMAKLGGVLFSQFSDLANFAAGMHDQGTGLLEGHARSVSEFVRAQSPEAKQRGRLLGVYADGVLGEIQRRFSAVDGPVGKMAEAQAAFFRLTGMEWWSRSQEAAIANATSANLAESALKGFADLGPRERMLLELHGLGDERWEIVREARELASDGRHYVMPQAIAAMDPGRFEPLVAERMQDAEDALRERVQAQTAARRKAAQTRQADRVRRAERRLREADAIVRPHNRARAIEARSRALAAAREALRLATERATRAAGAPARELTAAERAGLEARRQRLLLDERRRVELDLRSYIADEAHYGVIKGDDRTRALVLQGQRPGTPLGELARFAAQFQTFGVAYAQRRLGRTLRGYPGADPTLGLLKGVGVGVAKNLPAVASLIAATTIYGYLSMSAKDIVKDRTPKDPTRVSTILAAMVQGGGFGLFGDFLFGQYDRFGGGVGSRLLGPFIGEAASLVDLLNGLRQAALHKVDPDVPPGSDWADVLNFALNNSPFLNIFYVRAALNLAILNALQEWMSPGTLHRREKKVLQQFGQRYLIDPTPLAGRPPPGVRPALGG